MAMEGIWNQLAVLVAPILETIGALLADIAGWLANVLDSWNDFWASDDVKRQAAAQEEYAKQTKKAQQALEAETKAAEEAAKAREDLEKRGASLTESLRTPIEMYKDKLAEFDELLKEGAISFETYSRAVNKATEELKKSEEFKKKETKALERQGIGVNLRGAASTLSVQQKQVRTMEKQLQEQKLARQEEERQTELLQQINQNIGLTNVVQI